MMRSQVARIRLVFISIALVVALFGGTTVTLISPVDARQAPHPTVPPVVAFDLEDYAPDRP